MSELKSPKYWIALPVILLLYVFLKASGQHTTMLMLRLIMLAVGYTAALTDLREKRVPNKLVLGLAAAWLLVLAPLALTDPQAAMTIGIRGLLGAVAAAVVMLFVYVVSRRGLGGGDVKLMCVMGLYLGIDGTLTALLYGSVMAALTSLVLVLMKKLTAKDAIPLVPFLYAGMVIAEYIR